MAPVIVVFGITGDLSKRKLLPALYHLLSQGLLPEDTRIVGISRQPLSVDELLSTVELCVLEKDNVCDPVGLQRVHAALQTHQLNPEQVDDFHALKQLLDSFDTPDAQRQRLLYLSIPAAAYEPVIGNLAAAGLHTPNNRLLLEKPFGYNLASAEELIDLVNQHYEEDQVYRIDHYLTKETAQNMLTFRMHNPIFSPLWNAEHIQRVHILATEALGIEGRANFYEQTGALRDLVQSHLMQLLAITLMDVPPSMTSDDVHLSKQHFLEQLRPASAQRAVRGQYNTYRSEVNNEYSNVETYTRISLEHSAERWQGTEIILETGKGLDRKTTEIIVEFKTPHERRRNSLIFRVQPNEGIGLELVVKEPGLENHMRHTALEFSYDEAFKHKTPVDAYERVLLDAVRGDQALFASDREVLATWHVLQPLIDAWSASGDGLVSYPVGAAPQTIHGQQD